MVWTKFDRKIRIISPISNVFAAWVDPSVITKWFLKEIKLVDSNHSHSKSPNKSVILVYPLLYPRPRPFGFGIITR